MKFDCIIMNPPYERNLHLKILEKAITFLKDDNSICINLSPVPYLTSIRNIWHEKSRNNHNKVKAYEHLDRLIKIEDGKGIELFNAGIQQHLGIQVYKLKKHKFDCITTAICPYPHSLTKKIMKKCMEYNITKNCGSGEYILQIAYIHGHIGKPDFLNIFSLTYESQLKCKDKFKLYFKTEQDRHNFYDFWMSKLGKFIISLWKVDTHVMHNFIPYIWFTNNNDFYKFFDITEDEKKIIEDTMKKYQ